MAGSGRGLDPLTAAAFDAHVDLAAHIGGADLIARRGYLKLYRTEEAFAASMLEREILIHHKESGWTSSAGRRSPP